MVSQSNPKPGIHFPDLKKDREINSRYFRLKKAVEDAGSNLVVAPRANVAASTLSSYLNGGEWKLSVVEKIANACGVSLQWLLFGNNEATPLAISAVNDDTALIDYYDVAASAGFGMSYPDTPKPKKMAISRHFLRSELGLAPSSTIMLQVSGDSMEPTMRAGDKLIIDTDRRQLLDGIHVLVASGTLLVKRLSAGMQGTVRIISDNERYPVQEAEISRFHWGEPDGGGAITVIGRVAYRLQAMS
jgi:phage repressor protein C with HTH and peptisase S24 domain